MGGRALAGDDKCASVLSVGVSGEGVEGWVGGREGWKGRGRGRG